MLASLGNLHMTAIVNFCKATWQYLRDSYVCINLTSCWGFWSSAMWHCIAG